MSDPCLDEFGKFLMSKVRDQVIQVFDDRLTGRMRGDVAAYFAEVLKQGGQQAKDTVTKLLPDAIDLTLHYLLWSLEESTRIHIVVKDQSECPESLKLRSDGFPGELYTEEGWIAKFSRERRGYF